MKVFSRHLAILLLLFLAPFTFGHKASDSYLRLSFTNQTLNGEWHIAIRDLANVLELDANGDLAVTWSELLHHRQAIEDLAFASLTLQTRTDKITLQPFDFLVDHHSDGGYVVIRFASSGAAPPDARLTYNLFFDIDAQHRGIVFLGKGEAPAHVFNPDARTFTLDPADPPRRAAFAHFVGEGVWHIWKGFDHLLFLLTLILPTVIRREGLEWRVAQAFRPVFFEVAKVVTAFTVAHSITLTLAAIKAVILPLPLVESVIAASVVVAALNNVRPFLRGRTWIVAFAFGLVHGFGFASVFADLGVAQTSILQPLLAFNIGVELGQLAVVSFFLPIAYLFRMAPGYRMIAVQAGSAVVAVVAATWTLERALHFKLLPF